MRTLRRTIDILPDREIFWHDNYPEPPAPVSRCTSSRPQAVCTCEKYNLKWEDRWPDERADAEREQARAEHLGELAAEREMVQAQTPVVNVQEAAE